MVVYVLLFGHVFVFLKLKDQRCPEGDTAVSSVWTEGQLLGVPENVLWREEIAHLKKTTT